MRHDIKSESQARPNGVSASAGRSHTPAFDRRGGRMTKWKGEAASYAPNAAQLVSPTARAWAVSLLPAALLISLAASPAGAADLYWDANNSGIGIGGDGAWNTTASSWNTTGNGVAGPFAIWNNGNLDNAIFDGTAGTVTLGAPVTAHNLTFAVGGYALTGGTLTLGGATPTITVTAGTSTINSAIAGTAGLTKAGAGTLALGGANTFSGGITVNGGTLTVGADAALGAAGNGLFMAGGTTATLNGALAAGRVVTLGSGGLITVSGVGAGGARYTGLGGLYVSTAITLSNNANDYTGLAVLSAGSSFTSVGNIGQASSVGAGDTVGFFSGLPTISGTLATGTARTATFSSNRTPPPAERSYFTILAPAR
jgi:fibronectin-binding autotransporter adhesin